jgi:hypothetical protein
MFQGSCSAYDSQREHVAEFLDEEVKVERVARMEVEIVGDKNRATHSENEGRVLQFRVSFLCMYGLVSVARGCK